MRAFWAWSLILLYAAASARAQYIFAPPVPLAAHLGCRSVIAFVPRVGQQLSLAALSTNGSAVCLFRGDGAGGFGRCEAFPTGTVALGLGAGDTTIDLRPDLLLPTAAPAGFAVMQQLDSGGFSLSQPVSSGGPTACAAAADIDGDGDTDVVAAYSGTPAMRILLNNGAGDLGPAATLQLPAAAVFLGAIDLNGDTLPELLAVCRNSDQLAVFPNAGGGQFGPRVDLAAGSRPNSVAVVDVDGGGLAGLALSNENSGAITLLPGMGQLLFGPPHSVPVGLQPVGVFASDLDRNGRAELVAPLGGSASFAVLTRGPNGEWSLQTYPLPARSAGAALGDFDRDGDDDIAVALAGEAGLRVLENRSSVDPCRADFDRDGAVAFADVTRVLTLWMTSRPDDPNDNGVVDFADLTFILLRWGRDCTPLRL